MGERSETHHLRAPTAMMEAASIRMKLRRMGERSDTHHLRTALMPEIASLPMKKDFTDNDADAGCHRLFRQATQKFKVPTLK